MEVKKVGLKISMTNELKHSESKHKIYSAYSTCTFKCSNITVLLTLSKLIFFCSGYNASIDSFFKSTIEIFSV